MCTAERSPGETSSGLGGQRPVRLRRGHLAGGPGRPRRPSGHKPAQGKGQEGLLRHQQQHQDEEDVRRQIVYVGVRRERRRGVRDGVLLRHVPEDCVPAAGQSVPDRKQRDERGAGGGGAPADRGGTRPRPREADRLGQRASGSRGEGCGCRFRRTFQLHEAEQSHAVPDPAGLSVCGDQQGHQVAPGGRQGCPRYRLLAAGRGDCSPAPGPDGGQTQPLHVRLRGRPVRRGPRPLPDGGRPLGHGHHAGLQLRPEDPAHPHGGQHRGGRRGPSEERLRGEAGDGAGLLRGEHRRASSSSAGMKALQGRRDRSVAAR
ncbi:hypothetical protein PFLUV_G00245990 [Perca fluviatilis]|uniref:Uncharacterized protein n=1 Tax=Perca fluviatilis TaxID=8168 RepID=A0A6A5EDV5_PERFL|nr:hypothetical protein PFLUV_G00245990 [Perca fluviatilis]